MMHSFTLAKLFSLFVFTFLFVVQVKGDDTCGKYFYGPEETALAILKRDHPTKLGDTSPFTPSGDTMQWTVKTKTAIFSGFVRPDKTLYMASQGGMKNTTYYYLITTRRSGVAGVCWIRTIPGDKGCTNIGDFGYYKDLYTVSVYM
jgi:hypothetical protein